MNDIEIIFELTAHEKLRDFFNIVVTFNSHDVISSHFYDDDSNSDLEYGEIDDFCSFALSNSSTSSLFSSSVNCGIEMRRVVILISHDSLSTEVSLNVEISDFCPNLDDCAVLIQHMLISISSGIVDNVKIGYDPAHDEDMRIISLTRKGSYDTCVLAKTLYKCLNIN